MTKNYDPGIIEDLRAAYEENRRAAMTIKYDIRQKYKKIMADELQRERAASDQKFAEYLIETKERAGIPVTVIQDEVLRTRSWSRWTKWRDYGKGA